MKKFYVFYQTFIFTNVGEVALKVVQGVPDGHSLLASKFNGVYTTWNLVCETRHLKNVMERSVNFDFILLNVFKTAPITARRDDVMEVL